MVSAIGASLPFTTPTTVGAAKRAELDPELARNKKEYAACVNCESANTEAGERNIQMLDMKIKQIESHMTTVQAPTSTAAPAASTAATTADLSIGGQLDVYA